MRGRRRITSELREMEGNRGHLPRKLLRPDLKPRGHPSPPAAELFADEKAVIDAVIAGLPEGWLGRVDDPLIQRYSVLWTMWREVRDKMRAANTDPKLPSGAKYVYLTRMPRGDAAHPLI